MVQPLWECWLVDGPPLGVLGRRESAERRVRSVGVVLDPPPFGEDLGLEETGELLGVQQLVAHPAVEALDEGVLPGRAGLDVGRGRPGQATPLRISWRSASRRNSSSSGWFGAVGATTFSFPSRLTLGFRAGGHRARAPERRAGSTAPDYEWASRHGHVGQQRSLLRAAISPLGPEVVARISLRRAGCAHRGSLYSSRPSPLPRPARMRQNSTASQLISSPSRP